MSERLVIPDRANAENEVSVAHPWWQFSVRFNVAESQSVPVVRMHERESEGVMMRWGLGPSSAKGDVARRGCALVRADTLLSSEDSRTAWLNGQRGIVPLAGFYVWQRTQAGYRQPYYVRLVNRLVFGVAVLWERSVTDDDDVVECCALMSVPANPLLAAIDDSTTGQMPAILRREDYDTWLRSSVAEASRLLGTYPQTRMLSHPVAPHVNHLEFDEPWLIRPAPQDPVE
jgi:putative SOS response-associated peptidase YedK